MTEIAQGHRVAGTTWIARLRITDGLVHWYVRHELEHRGPASLVWCSQREGYVGTKHPITELAADLTGGEPCPTCAAKWPLPGEELR